MRETSAVHTDEPKRYILPFPVGGEHQLIVQVQDQLTDKDMPPDVVVRIWAEDGTGWGHSAERGLIDFGDQRGPRSGSSWCGAFGMSGAGRCLRTTHGRNPTRLMSL